MKALEVHIDTLKVVGQCTVGNYTFDQHTIEVSIGSDRRVVRCSTSDDHVTIHGMAVRFNQGTKVWPGSAVYWLKNGTVNNLRPNIDKRGYFLLVGFAEDFAGKAVRSQHNAVA
jgi:hypothetical protein